MRRLPLSLVSASVLCAGSVLLSAQTTHLTVHRHVVHHAAAACPAALPAPVTPPGLPAATGPVQTAFALRYIDMVTGTGALAQPGDFLTVQYTGWLAASGLKFDSSLDRNQPFTFPQGAHRVIPGWDEGFDGMHVGGKRRLFIPWQLAYGADGRGPIPPKADLIFDIELVAASATPPGEPAAPPPPAPPTGAGAPQ